MQAPGVLVEHATAVGEVEAWHTLTVTCDDRAGLLADLSEHIRFCGVDIVSASVATDTHSGLIVDSFAVRDAVTGGRLSAPLLESLSASLWQVAIGAAHPKRLSGGASFSAGSAGPTSQPASRRANSGNHGSTLSSLTTVGEAESAPTPNTERRASIDGQEEEDQVTFTNDDNDKFTMLRVELPDRPGLLTDLVQTLRVANVSVVAASITTRGSTAVDVFKITDGATGGKVSSEKFELLRRGVAHRARRQAISQSLGHAPLGGLASSPPAVPPSAEELAVVDAACLALPPFTPLLTAERHDIYAQMHRLAFSSGELLLLEGTEVQQFFVVQSGDVRGCGSGRTLRCGDVLGELGIVQTALSQDSWRAGAAGCVVSVVDRRKLHALLHSAAGQRRARAASALQELPMLEGLTKGQLYTLVDCMRRCELPQGAPLSHAFLHILLRGQVQLSDRGALHRGAESGEEEEPAGPLAAPVLARVGDAFGEAACLANGASPAGIAIATVSKVEVMWCDRDTFVRVLGPPEHLLLPGTVRKVSPQRTAAAPTLLPPGGAGASLALGGDAIAEEDELMLEEEEEHAPPVPRPMASQAVQVSAFRPLAAAPADRQTDTAAVDAADEALVAAALASAAGSGGVNRFRTPNQDVSWHGRSAALEALQSSAGPCSQDGLRSTLSSSRRLSSSLAQHAAPLALAAASQPSAAITRACSAPAALSNIAGGTPSPGGGALVPKGAWRLSLALGDFLLGSKLGEGLTGRVHYAQLKVRGVECALKIMRKAKLIELGEEHHVRSELEALGRIGSPFVTQLLGCFQDKHAVYLAIEYMRGPDLFAYMHEINAPAGFERSVPIAAVRFYTAQVLLGLDALHSNGYVYRDLKPENILMDGSGNLKLADLGFAKLVFEGGRAYTVCGTPDYLAPEVIEHRGATRGSDYWALGILIFEFIAGFPPFQGEPKWYQFKKICAGSIEYWPERFPKDAYDIVRALLHTDESRRLGLLAGGVGDIQAHPFYAELDWHRLLNHSAQPPFRPSEHEWGQATTTPADSKRVLGELHTLVQGDAQLSAAAEDIFHGYGIFHV